MNAVLTRLPVPIDQSMVILRASNETSSEPLWRIAISFAPVKCRHAAPSPPPAIREQILRRNSNSNNKHWLRKFKEVVIVSSLWPTSMFIFSRIISGKHVRDSKYDFTVESIGQANPLPGDSATVKQGEEEATSGYRGHFSFRYYGFNRHKFTKKPWTAQLLTELKLCLVKDKMIDSSCCPNEGIGRISHYHQLRGCFGGD